MNRLDLSRQFHIPLRSRRHRTPQPRIEPAVERVIDEAHPDIQLPAVDLATARKEHPEAAHYDLLAIPADRRQGASIDLGASLLEAQQRPAETGADLPYVASQTVPGIPRMFGVITPEDVEQAYRFRTPADIFWPRS